MIYKQELTVLIPNITSDIDNVIEYGDFFWEVANVTYDWVGGNAQVQVLFWKINKGNAFKRTFILDCNTEWSTQDVIDNLLTLDCFNGSVVI